METLGAPALRLPTRSISLWKPSPSCSGPLAVNGSEPSMDAVHAIAFVYWRVGCDQKIHVPLTRAHVEAWGVNSLHQTMASTPSGTPKLGVPSGFPSQSPQKGTLEKTPPLPSPCPRQEFRKWPVGRLQFALNQVEKDSDRLAERKEDLPLEDPGVGRKTWGLGNQAAYPGVHGALPSQLLTGLDDDLSRDCCNDVSSESDRPTEELGSNRLEQLPALEKQDKPSWRCVKGTRTWRRLSFWLPFEPTRKGSPQK